MSKIKQNYLKPQQMLSSVDHTKHPYSKSFTIHELWHSSCSAFCLPNSPIIPLESRKRPADVILERFIIPKDPKVQILEVTGPHKRFLLAHYNRNAASPFVVNMIEQGSSTESNLNSSRPSILMPLVSPFLSYEDTCRCMQLNSSFQQYIDENWKDMAKQGVHVRIRKPFCLAVSFGKGGQTQRGTIYAATEFLIEDHVLSNSTRKTPLFLLSYLDKQASPIADSGTKVKYAIEKRALGLKILLEALLLRFSLLSFGMIKLVSMSKIIIVQE